MSLPVFLADTLSGDLLELSGAEGRHAVTVKRMRAGEEISLIDGRGNRARVKVAEVSGKDHLVGEVLERSSEPRPRPYVTVVQALPKSVRSELAVDLAVQAGADEIIPWQAARCEAKWTAAKTPKQVGKWQDAALAAAKQSRRAWVPEIKDPVTTRQLAQIIAGETAYVLHEDAEMALTAAPLDVDKLFVIVGPEGGIGPEELAELGAESVRLGPEVYRTASAAMVALSAIGAMQRW